MFKIRMTVPLLLLIFLNNFSWSATNVYKYSFDDPASLVTAAGHMIMNADYAPLLDITEKTEKKKAESTLDSINNDPGFLAELKKESSELMEFDLLNTEIYTNDPMQQLAAVSIKWKIKLNDTVETSDNLQLKASGNPDLVGKRNSVSEVYVNYLLKIFDGKWKIVSTRTLN